MCHEEIIYFRNMITHHYEKTLRAVSMKNRENHMNIVLIRELNPCNNFPELVSIAVRNRIHF